MELAGHDFCIGNNYVRDGLVVDKRNFTFGKLEFPVGSLDGKIGYTIDLYGKWVGSTIRDGNMLERCMLDNNVWLVACNR